MKRILVSLFIALGMMTTGSALATTDQVATGEPTSERGNKDKQKETKEEEPATPEEATAPEKVERPAPESRKWPPITQAEVDRGHFTTGIKGREPVDNVNAVDNTTDTVFFFTEIRDGRGQTITHEWWHDGERIAEVPFNIGGNRWRVWSSKDMLNEWTGDWTVRVVDSQGNKLSEQSFRYTNAPEPAQAEDEPPADDKGRNNGKGQDKDKDNDKDKGPDKGPDMGMGDDRSDKKSGKGMDMESDAEQSDEEDSGDEGGGKS